MANDEEKKKPDLDKIAEDMDPDKINEKVEIPHITAHNKYLPKLENKLSINDYEEFRKEIIAYMKHHHKQVYKTDMPDEIAFSRAQQILESAFGDKQGKGGFIKAYKEARKGRLGDVIKALADGEETEHKSSYVKNIFSQVDPLDWDSHVDLVRQYKSKYGKFLSKDLKTKSDEQLAHRWDLLRDHHIGVVEGVKGYAKKYTPKKKAA